MSRVQVFAALRGDPVSTLTALRAASRYGEAMAVERGGIPLTDVEGCRLLWRRRRVGDVHWVAIREMPDGGFTVEPSWLRFAGADVYASTTPGEALNAAVARARDLMKGMGGRWEEAIADGRAAVSAGGLARPEDRADGVAGNPPRQLPRRAPVDAAGKHARRAPACGEHNGHRVWSCATEGCDSEPIVDPVPDETCSGPTGGPRF